MFGRYSRPLGVPEISVTDFKSLKLIVIRNAIYVVDCWPEREIERGVRKENVQSQFADRW